MKTIEQYQKEFKEAQSYEERIVLAKQRIEEYPDDKESYTILGCLIAHSFNDKQSEQNSVDEFTNCVTLAQSNSKYFLTLEQFYTCYSYPLHLDAILPKDNNQFANIWLKAGCNKLKNSYRLEAKENFKNAWKLGIDYHKFIDILNPPIKSIDIEDFLCIDSIKIEDIADKKEIYFLGENGVGKTVLLQAIVLGLTNNREAKKLVYILNSLDVVIKNNFPKVSLQNTDCSEALNLFAYGTNRFRDSKNSANIGEYGCETLFDKDTLLINPIQFFKDVDYKATKNLSSIKIETILQLFEEIIDFDATKSFKIEQEGINFIFYEKGTKTEFDRLASGYQSVLILLCDLLSRLTKNQPYIKDLKDFYGIVLVDEVDMFLHPKWEYKIVKMLRTKLPNIQWFFTTHSPMLILGASTDAVFYKLYKEDGKTKCVKPFSKPLQMTANSLITSMLWDVENFTTKAIKNEQISSDDYIFQKIHAAIAERIKNMPHLTDDAVFEEINRMLEAWEKEDEQ